jgi:hypothetical protein
MNKVLVIAFAVIIAIGFSSPAYARKSKSNTPSSPSYSSPEFRTFHCKKPACFQKNPKGTWVHPITPKKR